MATTSPDNLRTPNPGDSYNLVPDLATLANDVQAALLTRSARFGTAAQRADFLSTAPVGFLWQDTDGIGMLWKKSGAAWVPAVWRWSGTTAQMNAFTQAPNGFEWFNTSDSANYTRFSGVWSRGLARPLTLGAGFSAWSGRLNSSSLSGGVVTAHLAVTRATAIGNSVHLATLPIPPLGGFFAGGFLYGSGTASPLEVDVDGKIATPSAGMPASITVITASFSYMSA